MLQPSDEIKSRLDIVELIREYIPLKAAGINFQAKCPFHREKTPSFMVSPEKQIWHCFGCGEGGDAFSFVMKIEGLSFIEALRLLAPKAGVVLKAQNPKLTSQRNRLLDILEAAAKYYHQVLLEKPEAEPIRQYLSERKLSAETISEWRIGYSPDSWDDLIKRLLDAGYKENEIFLAGLSVKKEGTGRFYNRFRNRIMFPLSDPSGNVVAFSARVNPAAKAEEKLGKYINSPQTLVYDKSKLLYGLDKAKLAIKNEDKVVVVEGQLDVISAQQNGFKNTVASSGTALSREQLLLIKRYTNNIYLAFDADAAGELAADRGIREAMREEMNIKIISIPAGKDPDEFIKKNPAGWRSAVEAGKHLMQYYFDQVFTGPSLDDIDQRRKAVNKLLPIISRFSSRLDQDFWLKKLSDQVDVPENILKETLLTAAVKERNYETKAGPREEFIPKRDPRGRDELLSELFLALLIKFPELIDYAANNIYVDQIAGRENKLFYKDLIIYYNKVSDNQAPTPTKARVKAIYPDLKVWFENNVIANFETNREEAQADEFSQLKLLDKLVILGDKDFYDFDAVKAKTDAIKLITALKRSYLVNQMKEIEKLIADSEKEGDNDKIGELMSELKMLGEEMRNIG